MSEQEEQEQDMAEAAVELAQEKRDSAPRKPVNRDAARRHALAASEVARAFLAQEPPKLAPEADAVPAEVAPRPLATAHCSTCSQELGHAVYGVNMDGVWHCPTCFIRNARSYERHPAARAITCPTCRRQSVDFSGRNICPVCRARGARPIRPS